MSQEHEPEKIDTMAHYIAEALRGNPAMGGPLSCHITEMHRRIAMFALAGLDAWTRGLPQSIQRK